MGQNRKEVDRIEVKKSKVKVQFEILAQLPAV